MFVPLSTEFTPEELGLLSKLTIFGRCLTSQLCYETKFSFGSQMDLTVASKEVSQAWLFSNDDGQVLALELRECLLGNGLCLVGF